MAKRRASIRGPQAARSDEPSQSLRAAPWVRQACLAGTVALMTAVPVIPGEAVGERGTTVVAILLWLLLLTGWAVAGLFGLAARIRWGAVDIAFLVFLVLHTLSALVMAHYGHARPAINMAWQWVSFGVCFFLVRQVVDSAGAARAVIAVMASLALGLSAFGLYQYSFGLSQWRAEYQRDPERVLRANEIDPTPGSPERKWFEDRLASTEPMATFALANSLAGFLVPWLLILIAVAAMMWRERSGGWLALLGAILAALVIAFCLLLTKSRTAVLATCCGLLLVGWQWWRGERRISWKIPAVVAGAVLLLSGGVILAGGFDWLVVSEAPKSVLYRLQYWRSTLALIADSPWLGCGPGNFQSCYAAYKLPEASEMIADPHNFLLEIWATAGTPAVAALAALFGLWLWSLRGGKGLVCGPGTPARPAQEDGPEYTFYGAVHRRLVWLYAGGLSGVVLGLPCSAAAGMTRDVMLLVVGLPAMAFGLLALHPWVVRGRLPVWLLVVAAGALLLNLLAAGGISFAGVAQNLWVLMAVSVHLSDRRGGDEESAGPRGRGRTAFLGLAFFAGLLVASYHQTMYQPLLERQMRLVEGMEDLERGRYYRAEAAFRAAAAADPYSVEPWSQLAMLYNLQATARDGADHQQDVQRFEQAVAQMVSCDPRSHRTWRQIGDWRLALYRALGDQKQLDGALHAYEQAVRRYPHSNAAHAQLAWALHQAGQAAAGQAAAAEALRLDALCPHMEKRLEKQRLFDPAGGLAATQNAEQLMRWLRND